MLHSAALRRLAGKTQVVGPGEGAEVSGVPRTRLTHSLEVAQIGRAIAEELGATPTSSTPPASPTTSATRRSGTTASGRSTSSARACGGFEGNAQTLRILMRLEPKVDGTGLNLTRATLDAACKYPWLRRSGLRKFGAYADDAALLAWVRDGAPPGRCCLEAQIMDWADDVAYSVHDVEDGILAGRIDLATLAVPGERAALVELAARHFGAEPDALEAAADALLALPVVRRRPRLRRPDRAGRRAHRAQAADQRARRPVRRRRDGRDLRRATAPARCAATPRTSSSRRRRGPRSRCSRPSRCAT